MIQSIRWAFNWKEWTPNEKDFAYAISCVQLEEKERLDRFVFRKDVRASLVGRLLMRKFVNEYGHVPYSNVVFGRDAHNRPIVTNTSLNLSFNVSHQGTYTVLAGETRDLKLGIDVMKLEYKHRNPISEYFRIMNRNFSLSEWKEIKDSSLDESAQLAMFYRHWALKESYTKALSIGLTTDLGALAFKTSSNLSENFITTDTALYINNIKQDWLFEETLLDSEHCVSVALQENGKAPKSQNNTFEIISSVKLFAYSIPLFPQDLKYAKKYFEKEEHP